MKKIDEVRKEELAELSQYGGTDISCEEDWERVKGIVTKGQLAELALYVGTDKILKEEKEIK